MHQHESTSQDKDRTQDLTQNARYRYFIETVVTLEGVWGLYHNGWLLCSGDNGTQYCPFFASHDHADAWNAVVQTGYIPTAITLVEWTESLLPDLNRNHIAPGISPTGDDGPFLPGHDPLHSDLIRALKDAITGK